jgi:hypothetical protein
MKLRKVIVIELRDTLIEKALKKIKEDFEVITTSAKVKKLLQSIELDDLRVGDFWTHTKWKSDELSDVIGELIAIDIGYETWPFYATLRGIRSKAGRIEFWKKFQRKLLKAGYRLVVEKRQKETDWYKNQCIYF